MNIKDKIDGTLYGFAFGDAWGAVTEFMDYKEISAKHPPVPRQLVVTDDTQMGLYTMQAVMDSNVRDMEQVLVDPTVRDRVRLEFAYKHLDFYYDPDNNRAPGITCMTSLKTFATSPVKITGMEGNLNDSKGCGTIMRAPWLGLLPYSRETIAVLAVLQSQTTHGNPVSWVAAAVAAVLTHDIFRDDKLREEMVDSSYLSAYAVTVAENLQFLTRIFYLNDAVDEITIKLREVENKIRVFVTADFDSDPSEWFGAGWVADEALYCAVGVASTYSSVGSQYGVGAGIARLVYTSGDSDSVAAIGGGLLGLIYGNQVLTNQVGEVAPRLEVRYQEELKDLSDWLVQVWS